MTYKSFNQIKKIHGKTGKGTQYTYKEVVCLKKHVYSNLSRIAFSY